MTWRWNSRADRVPAGPLATGSTATSMMSWRCSRLRHQRIQNSSGTFHVRLSAIADPLTWAQVTGTWSVDRHLVAMSSRGLLRLEHELVLRSTFLAQRYDTLRLRERFTLLSCQVASDLGHFASVIDHVQHQSAAAVAPLTNRQRPSATSPAAQRPSATLLPLATDQRAAPTTRKQESPGWAQLRGWPAQCPGVPLHRQGHPKVLSKPLRRKHLRDPPLSGGASAPPPVRNQGSGRSLPGPDAGHPLHSAGGHGQFPVPDRA